MDSFEGVVTGEPGTFTFVDATMRVGKKSHDEKRAGSTFRLLLADDSELRIEGVEEAEKHGRIILQGAYGTLLDAPMAKLFTKRAPGDHVKVQIIGFALCVGDRVRVEGTVLETASAVTAGDEGGMREAPKRVPSVVRAARLIIEGNAPELASRRAPSAASPSPETAPARHRAPASLRPLGTSTRVYALMGLVLTLGCLALMKLPFADWRNWLSPAFSLGLVFGTIALMRRLRGVHHGPYVSAVGGAPLSRPGAIWGYGMELPVFVFGFLFFAPVTVLESRPSTVASIGAAAALLPLIHGLIVFAQDRALRRFGRLVLFAQPSAGEGRMGRFEGSMEEHPPGGVEREVVFVTKSQTSTRTGKDGQSYESTTTTVVDRVSTRGKAFALKTPEGDQRVVPQDAHIVFAKRKWESGAQPSYEEHADVGESVLVVGRSVGGSIEHGGDESMFIWVGSRAQLWRSWAFAWLRPLGYFAISGALAWVAFHVMPFAETWHVAGTIEDPAAAIMTTTPRTCDAYVLRYFYNGTPRCTVHLTCEGEALYGGYGLGQMDCSGSPESILEGADSDAEDGDPALRFSIAQAGPGEIIWYDAQRRMRIQVGAAEPTLWHH